MVVPGVWRLGSRYVNWYLVEDGGRITVVDASLPGYWPQLDPALAAMDRRFGDVAALILTHAHGDHVGVAGELHERGVPVLLHPDDEQLMRTHKQPKREASPLPNLWRPGVWGFFLHFIRNGALKAPKIEDTRRIADGEQLDVPGRPRVVHTPGHTVGHCTFLFPEHRVAFVGDALCTWNPLTGRTGPQLMPRAFGYSSADSAASLERIGGLDADTVLPGHGEPWTGGAAGAAQRAREAGPS
jgi:glyoxylase-like metal-dependent hydrolase (beta-lactamase superfamily II)